MINLDHTINLIRWLCGPDWAGLWIGVFSIPLVSALWAIGELDNDAVWRGED